MNNFCFILAAPQAEAYQRLKLGMLGVGLPNFKRRYETCIRYMFSYDDPQ